MPCRYLLFDDDAEVATHTQQELQSLMDLFSQVCKDFRLTISLTKKNTMGHDTEVPPFITRDDYTNSLLSGSSHTSAPPSLTTSHWTHISTIGLGIYSECRLLNKPERLGRQHYLSGLSLCYRDAAPAGPCER